MKNAFIAKLANRITKRLLMTVFPGSARYWEKWYAAGGTSGSGSYKELALYKAAFLNAFVQDNIISSVIEFGCGDGNQLCLAKYSSYVGMDVSSTVIRRCISSFGNDQTKSFYLYDSRAFSDRAHLFRAELALSLDVIYHLIEDEIYHAYMGHLFDAASKFVVIYAWDEVTVPSGHVRHRKFTEWIANERQEWTLIEINQRASEPSGACDFFVYKKAAYVENHQTE